MILSKSVIDIYHNRTWPAFYNGILIAKPRFKSMHHLEKHVYQAESCTVSIILVILKQAYDAATRYEHDNTRYIFPFSYVMFEWRYKYLLNICSFEFILLQILFNKSYHVKPALEVYQIYNFKFGNTHVYLFHIFCIHILFFN